jgi:uncharacterized repeat protein (TIGR03837 family)
MIVASAYQARYHCPVTIDILCKVVDNYGDIGVAWRLARALSESPQGPHIRLVVSELASFALLNPDIEANTAYQKLQNIEVIAWESPLAEKARQSYRDNPPRSIVECFACGRPDWLEDMLFAQGAAPSSIVDLEHLTAEPYALEFHRMASLTRSPLVQKAMFLPGFEEGTGGLIMDRNFEATLQEAATDRLSLRREVLAQVGAASPCDYLGRFWVAVFSYERDYSRIITDLAAFEAEGCFRQNNAMGSGPGILVLAAAGPSQACVSAAWDKAGRPFPILQLPFLPQAAWDRVLAASDFLIVRGEDSWARAALIGRPFLWHAYPQAERYQMVKVEAFLTRLRRHFAQAEVEQLEKIFRLFNDRDFDAPDLAGNEELFPLLRNYASLEPGFSSFAASLKPLTGLASDLLDFFCKNQ